MKKLIFSPILLFFLLVSMSLSAQSIRSYKVKTKYNKADRTKILDIVRANLYKDYKQEFIFVVNTLNVSSSNYAWFQGNAQRRDGRKVRVSEYDDCCHVEALLKKRGGKWYIVEMAAFATDVWWDGLWNRTPAPKNLFFY